MQMFKLFLVNVIFLLTTSVSANLDEVNKALKKNMMTVQKNMVVWQKKWESNYVKNIESQNKIVNKRFIQIEQNIRQLQKNLEESYAKLAKISESNIKQVKSELMRSNELLNKKIDSLNQQGR